MPADPPQTTPDLTRGEGWIIGTDCDGNPTRAPHLIQRPGETLAAFVQRVIDVEKGAKGGPDAAV